MAAIWQSVVIFTCSVLDARASCEPAPLRRAFYLVTHMTLRNPSVDIENRKLAVTGTISHTNVIQIIMAFTLFRAGPLASFAVGGRLASELRTQHQRWLLTACTGLQSAQDLLHCCML